MATGKEWDELIQYHNKENQDDKVFNDKRDEKHDNVNTNDDFDNWTTQHINDYVALHNLHIHKQFHWACTRSLVPCTFHHTHIVSRMSLVRTFTSPICMAIHVSVLSSRWSSPLYFPAFLLSFFLFTFFHLSDEQQPELNKKIMENLCNSATNGCVRVLTTSSTSPHVDQERPELSRIGSRTSPKVWRRL